MQDFKGVKIHHGTRSDQSGCLKWGRKTGNLYDEENNLVGHGEMVDGVFHVYMLEDSTIKFKHGTSVALSPGHTERDDMKGANFSS